MLCGDHYGMYSERLVVVAVLYGVLGFGIRAEIGHQLWLLTAYPGQFYQGYVCERKRQRHVLLGVVAGVAEHHALVSGPLLLLDFVDDPPVDVGRLLVQGREYAAGLGVEHIVGLGVADAVYDSAGHVLYVHVCVLRADLAADDDEPGADKGLAGNLGLGILTQEVIENSVRYLVGHFVRMALRN